MLHGQVAGRTLAILAIIGVSLSLHAQEIKYGNRSVQIHGFGTQGYIYTDDNNWLTMNTRVGSAEFTDMGLNAGSQLTSRLRVGAQVYDRELGQLGQWHPQLDWAMADFTMKPWLSFRGGKVKTVLGLYTNIQDLDFANTYALLPQGVYPIDLRDATIAHLGGDLYGKAKLPEKLGTIAYTAYGGRRSDSIYSGYPYLLRGYGIYLSSYGGPVYGGDLRWHTPLRGLTVGISRLNEQITGKGTTGGASYEEHSIHDWTNQYYGQYVRDNLHLESEYKRYLRDQDIFNGLETVETDVRAWYIGGGYRVDKWLEVGSYFSHYRIFSPSTGSSAYSDAQLHDYDKVVTAKFSFGQYTTVKIEGHFMDGNASALYPDGFYTAVNPSGFADNTNAIVVRTGFSF
jgi:hypothetical protein